MAYFLLGLVPNYLTLLQNSTAINRKGLKYRKTLAMCTVSRFKKVTLKQYLRMLPLLTRHCTNDADAAKLRDSSYEETYCGSGSKNRFKSKEHSCYVTKKLNMPIR